MLKIHKYACPRYANANDRGGSIKLQLSCDGVSESKSTTVSFDVYSVKFEKCKNVYPLRIVRHIKKSDTDVTNHLAEVVRDIYKNNCEITEYIADNPKRAKGKCTLNHASWHPCEYCFAKGTKIITNNSDNEIKRKNIEVQKKIVREKLEELLESPSDNEAEIESLNNVENELKLAEKKITQKKSNIVWPKSSAHAPKRTEAEILEIIEKIENNQKLSKDEAKGITGRSILFGLPNFDFTRDVPVDYLHCGCLGVIKKTVELTFSVGQVRRRESIRALSSPARFNELIKFIKSPFEFNRRVRDLDFSVYKGQEFRNLLLFFFPIVLTCIEETAQERQLWLFLTYILKACVVPNEEFSSIPVDSIERSSEKFYSLYESLFGVYNSTYNTHVFGSHITDMRCDAPLTETSAFPFESFYGEIRNSFVPGTPSTLKQIFSNVLIKRLISNHNCEKKIRISDKETALESNNLIYTYVDKEFRLYKVTKINADNSFTCVKQNTLECTFNEITDIDLQWNLVGVFKKGEIGEEEHTITMNEIKGKFLIVNDYLITCPNNVLREK